MTLYALFEDDYYARLKSLMESFKKTRVEVFLVADVF